MGAFVSGVAGEGGKRVCWGPSGSMTDRRGTHCARVKIRGKIICVSLETPAPWTVTSARASGSSGSCEHPSQPGSEFHFLGHCLAVLVTQVAVDLHGEGAAVLVAEPGVDGRDIDAALNAPGGKER